MNTIEQQDGQAPATSTTRPTWQLPAARAVPALLVGVAITFLQVHTPFVGFLGLAVLSAGSGVALLVLRGAVFARVRRWPVVAGAASLVVAVLALVFAVILPNRETLAAVAALWLLVIGAAELWGAWSMRTVRTIAGDAVDQRQRRIVLDWRTVGLLSLVAGLVVAVLPRHDIVLVGLIGAYGVIVGVFHGIAAASARTASRSVA